MKKLVAILAALAAAPLAHADEVGATQYDKRCAACHAKDGEAQTKMGAKLNVRPFSNGDVQAKLTEKDLAETISAGIPDKKMPAFKEKLAPDELDALVKYVLATFKKGGAPEAKPEPKAEAKPVEAAPAEVKPADATAATAAPEAKPADEPKPAKPSKKSKGKKAKSAKAAKPAAPAESKPAAP